MARTVTVTLGATTYAVKELPRKLNRRWLQSLVEPLDGMREAVADIWQRDAEQMDGNEVWDRLSSAGKRLLGLISTDRMLEMMYDYSPELAEDREAIEDDDELYDSEIVDAFVQVVTLATPFGNVVTQVRSLISSGARAIRTSTS